jgi:hypothetical protein
MNTVGLVGLCKIELPGGDVRLCDGGFIVFDSETYRSSDALLGTIASIQAMGEGIGPYVPAMEMVFLPPEASTPADLAQPGWQTSPARFWIGEYDPEAGTLIGDPDLIFDGQIDQASLSVGQTRELAVTVVSLAERLFERNAGNSLTSAWHKSIWTGELGHDNATGLSVQVAWGVASPQNAGTSYTPAYGAPGRYQQDEMPA